MADPNHPDDHSDPVILDDDDEELASFFAGGDHSAQAKLGVESVPDGGKDLTVLDAEPLRDAPLGRSNEKFWADARAAAGVEE